MAEKMELQRIDEYRWKIPKKGRMRVDGVIYADERMIETIRQDESLVQVANVAQLPGIVKASFAMPDIHWGYGFPIGGVAAFDVDKGVVSPGGVGYDINCSVRLLQTNLTLKDIEKIGKQELVHSLFRTIPSGVGKGSKFNLSWKELDEVL